MADYNDAYDAANTYVSNALSAGTNYIAALAGVNYTAPVISVTWDYIAPPSLPAIPATPSLSDITFDFTNPGPGTFDETAPTVVIDDFTEAAPELLLPTQPTLSYGSTPLIHEVADVAVPASPVIVLPSEPQMLSLSTVTFSGVDMHEGWLDQLENIPELTLLAPTPYSYTPGPEYASELLTALQQKLKERMLGGTGLTPAVEQAIWDRARDRETRTARANIDDIARTSEALGYDIPAGVMADQMRMAQQTYYDKLSELSRDVAIKQAELEQTNMMQAVTQTIQLEGQLIDYSYKMEHLAFEAAKQLADNAVQIYNAGVEGYKAVLDGYRTYAMAYKTIIDAELTKVEVYKAELQAEQTKAQINNTMVEQYKAQITASLAIVEVFKAELSASNTLIQLEQAKVQASAEQIKAYVAQVNGETAKVEAFKAGVQAQQAISDIYKAKVQAFSAKVGAQAEKAKAELGVYTAKAQTYVAEWDGYKAEAQAKGMVADAQAKQNTSLVEGYKAASHAVIATAESATALWKGQIAQYEASKQIALASAKQNTEAYMSTRQMAVDATKAGAQISGQMAAAALGQVHTTFGSSFGRQISYSYSNDTLSPVYSQT